MKKIKLTPRHLIYLLISLAVLGLDMLSKFLTVKYLEPIGTYKLIDGVFQLTYRENTGAAFSILQGKRVFFLIITTILVLFIAYLLCANIVENTAACCALAAIIGGGLGNMIDRAVNGYVVDMFDFCLINFAVFNVADIFITCGSILFLIIYTFSKGDIIKWK